MHERIIHSLDNTPELNDPGVVNAVPDIGGIAGHPICGGVIHSPARFPVEHAEVKRRVRCYARCRENYVQHVIHSTKGDVFCHAVSSGRRPLVCNGDAGLPLWIFSSDEKSATLPAQHPLPEFIHRRACTFPRLPHGIAHRELPELQRIHVIAHCVCLPNAWVISDSKGVSTRPGEHHSRRAPRGLRCRAGSAPSWKTHPW